MCEKKTRILKGQVVSFYDDPFIHGEAAVRHEERGAIVIEGEKIAWVGDAAELPQAYATGETEDHGDKLILPGFVDAHLHFPQYRMLAAFGKDLLDWLNRYTFIEEQRYGDQQIANAAAEFFLDELARNGTTSCLAFSTIHPVALEALFQAAQKRNMRMISGKTMMDRNAPEGLMDTATSAYDDSKALMDKWHGVDRLGYAITPRFAVTSSQAQLEVAGALLREHPEAWMQTHLSENHAEIEAVATDFPWSKDYTDVYDKFGLLGQNSFFAHGIHLSKRELARLKESRSKIAHCPTSNNFLGSGMMKVKETLDAGVEVAIGSDIGGGTSYSMLQTMRDAYTVSQHVGKRLTAFEAFYMATLGNAKLLGLEQEIGSIKAGNHADLIVVDPQATPIMKERHALSSRLHDVLFALLIMGDDRAISQTWIAGKKRAEKQSFQVSGS